MAGSVEVLVFPKTYTASVELIGEDQDQPLLIRGKIDNSGEAPKVLAEEIKLLASERQERTRRISFRLNALKVTEQQIRELDKLFKRHPGNLPVELIFAHRLEGETIRTILPLKLSLAPSEALSQEAERLFGEPTVFFQ
jgi:DNA polymerase III alpha subunit